MKLLYEKSENKRVKVYVKVRVNNIYNHRNKMLTNSIKVMESGSQGLDAVVYTENMRDNLETVMERQLSISENQKAEYIQSAIDKLDGSFTDLKFERFEISGNNVYAGDDVGYITHSYNVYVILSSSMEDVTIHDRIYLTPKNHKKRIRHYLYRGSLINQNQYFTYDELNDRIFIKKD